ncbi:MAG: adenosine deaminase, partial [Acidobacteria bacterium]|nr:adenosine deaminase [Acidobacteriota bacterium]
MKGFIHALPKAELHLHLEGSVTPETLSEIDPDVPPEVVREVYAFPDFAGFLQSFGWVVKRLRTPEQYGLVTRRLLERLAAENVRYAEIILSAGVVLWKEQEFEPVFEAVTAAAAGSPVRVAWILDAVRHFGVEHCMRVAELAAQRVDRGV